jgi:hypothetical protein
VSHHPQWQTDEIESLEMMWGKISARRIALKLGRSKDAIRRKALSMDLPKEGGKAVPHDGTIRERVEKLLTAKVAQFEIRKITGASRKYVESLALNKADRSIKGAPEVTEESDRAHYQLVRQHGGFKALDLPRPKVRLFFDGERLRRSA